MNVKHTLQIVGLFLVWVLIALSARTETEQAPYEVPDPATAENFRHIYYGVDDVNRRIDEINTAAAEAQATSVGNRVINGGFAVNQRSTTSATDDIYHLDRWYALTQTASMTVTQQTLQEDGQPTNLCMTQPGAAAQRIGTAQIIEAANSQDLRGQEVVLSARIRCSAAQAIRYAIIETTTTADSITSDIVRDWTSASYTAGGFFLSSTVVTGVDATTPSAATWTDISLTGTLTSNANNIVVFFWSEGTLAQSATLDIGKVQLENGTTATAFERRPFSQELSLCQRFFWKSFNQTVAVGQASGSTAGVLQYRVTVAGAAGVGGTQVVFPITMRTTPTITFYNPTSANSTWRNTSVGADSGTSAALNAGMSGFMASDNQVAGDTALSLNIVHATADAEL